MPPSGQLWLLEEWDDWKIIGYSSKIILGQWESMLLGKYISVTLATSFQHWDGSWQGMVDITGHVGHWLLCCLVPLLRQMITVECSHMIQRTSMPTLCPLLYEHQYASIPELSFPNFPIFLLPGLWWVGPIICHCPLVCVYFKLGILLIPH